MLNIIVNVIFILAAVSQVSCLPDNMDVEASGNLDSEIYRMKLNANPCLFGPIGPDVQVRSSLERRNNIVECMQEFERLVVDKLIRLGNFGQAMLSWMSILNTFERQSPSEFRRFQQDHNWTIPDALRSQLVDAFTAIKETNPVGSKYLELAYLDGSGVCVHTREQPMRWITINGGSYREHSTMVAGFNSLCRLCDLLTLHPNPGSAFMIFRDEFLGEPSDDVNRKFFDRFSEMLREIGSNAGIYVDPEFRKKLRPLQLLRNAYNITRQYLLDDEFVQKKLSTLRRWGIDLIRKFIEENKAEIEEKLLPIMNLTQFHVQLQRFMYQLNLISTYRMPSTQFNWFAQIIDVRTHQTTEVERLLFFDLSGIDYDDIDRVRAWKTGHGMCEMFRSRPWREVFEVDNPLLSFIYDIKNLYFAAGFQPTRQIMELDIISLSMICDQISMIPIE